MAPKSGRRSMFPPSTCWRNAILAQGSKLVWCWPSTYCEPESAPFLLDLAGCPGRRQWRGACALVLAQQTGRATTF
eukprot:2103353-Alexandrium_andersonii.AAC.1